jgi:hypothetical protein
LLVAGVKRNGGDGMSESKTPRTDSNEAHCREYSHSDFWVVSSDFAKELETENANLKKAVEELRKQLLFTAKYLREIGYTSREESELCRGGLKSGGAEAREMGFLECKPSLFPAAEYADSVADGIDHVLKETGAK